MTWANLVSLFGEHPLREVDPRLEVGNLSKMSVFQLPHPIFEIIYPARLGPTGPQSGCGLKMISS